MGMWVSEATASGCEATAGGCEATAGGATKKIGGFPFCLSKIIIDFDKENLEIPLGCMFFFGNFSQLDILDFHFFLKKPTRMLKGSFIAVITSQ